MREYLFRLAMARLVAHEALGAEVDEVLGPSRRRRGRLGDEDTRLPGPGPELAGSSRVAFCGRRYRGYRGGQASLDRVQVSAAPWW